MIFTRIVRYAAGIFLIAFFITAVWMPHEQAVIPDGRTAVICHSTERCITCRKIEDITRGIVDGQNGKVHFVSLEYNIPENKAFAEQFNIGTATVILVEKKNGEIVRSVDLTEPIWENVNDNNAMRSVIENAVIRF
ncbi:MAG: nitrophenyl compound nitroreductase subunit ArsF family protein [Planctomycetaceae bacterium]|jgi:hypothetical protein|nr:nitrophenyl compound nitroreductase subunit ArsF family protein [Planctomycetaceae bacterium]